MVKRLGATENLVQELLREMNIMKSQEKLRDKKVAHLEKQLRFQRQQNSIMYKMLKKFKLNGGQQDPDLKQVSPVLTLEKSKVKRKLG